MSHQFNKRSISEQPATATVTFNHLGVPVSTEFDDIYFNNENGLAESRYVFLQHNDLPTRWQTSLHSTFTVAETGFGTGLNFLACWQLFQQTAPANQRLHFISFEKYPLVKADLERALSAFPELAAFAQALLDAYPAAQTGCHRLQFDNNRVIIDLWFGDIHEQLPNWLPNAENSVDAWFLDGFAPDKNPQMWQANVYQAMAKSCRPSGTFATFTAAGAVRRGLQEAGFAVTKAKGFGRKREMLRGLIHKDATITPRTPETVTIVGGGIAAACLAWSLTQRGYPVHLLTQGIADGASGNAQGAVYPLLHAELSPLSQFYVSAFDHARQFYQSNCPNLWHATGVIQIAFNAIREQRQQKIADSGCYAPDLVRSLTAAETQQVWEYLPALPALFYPNSGWVPPQRLVQQILQNCGARLAITEVSEITELQQTASNTWRLDASSGKRYEASTLIVAAGANTSTLLAQWQIETQNVRGQVTQVAATEVSASCPMVVCYKGYFTPAENHNGELTHCVGATYNREFKQESYQNIEPADTEENLLTLQDNLAQAWTLPLNAVNNRASLRNTTRDHLPACGWLTDNLGVVSGLGSRGFTSAPLCAELLVSQWLGEPQPLADALIKRLAPQRLQVDSA
ncbi:MAG: bifunctional tRNA (5-methylaminomethyl-2-thiouridine)(34)-methyltransferase MnmD/FAD-dependent 5-carboxymethylaminomethyl-2-thiouridine(34) oxidoreductase MnmC [Idiomarina sp.]|nr:MAG: bifunctional tRNA (5-methylaminomethyl-2-thiouridine)(34)-methyltransferase MnmD/FAD-dependent 5-carboxymethylaminomethyl-2-thiouridine(34) oxidoreductase MnmC [Idiomarina sp.]